MLDDARVGPKLQNRTLQLQVLVYMLINVVQVDQLRDLARMAHQVGCGVRGGFGGIGSAGGEEESERGMAMATVG